MSMISLIVNSDRNLPHYDVWSSLISSHRERITSNEEITLLLRIFTFTLSISNCISIKFDARFKSWGFLYLLSTVKQFEAWVVWLLANFLLVTLNLHLVCLFSLLFLIDFTSEVSNLRLMPLNPCLNANANNLRSLNPSMRWELL